jgi:hypothetical protein
LARTAAEYLLSPQLQRDSAQAFEVSKGLS